MRKFLIPVALISAVAMAAPASAQRGLDQRFDQLAYQVERAADSGRISNHHARSLFRGLSNLDRTQRSYLSDGHLSRHERRGINAKYQSIRRQLRSAAGHDRGWDRGYRDDDRWDY